jgi:hypothetical protein
MLADNDTVDVVVTLKIALAEPPPGAAFVAAMV